jgi:hypothetical protein
LFVFFDGGNVETGLAKNIISGERIFVLVMVSLSTNKSSYIDIESEYTGFVDGELEGLVPNW